MVTESIQKGATRLLTEAARIAGFSSANGWPVEFSPRQMAALMAGGSLKEYKQGYRDCLAMIVVAIKSGALKTRVEQAPSYEQHCIGKYTGTDKWQNLDGTDARNEYSYTKTITPEPKHYLNSNAVASWLHNINEVPSAHVEAWLGDAWYKLTAVQATFQPGIALYAAAKLGGFSASDGWPDELTTVSLACLMANEEWASGNAADTWSTMLDDAVDACRLKARRVPMNKPGAAVVLISARGSWDYVDRSSFAAWLLTTNETPSAHVVAWLGNLLNNNGQDAETATTDAKTFATDDGLPIMDRRIKAILEAVEKMQFDVKKIPWGKKTAIQTECLNDVRLFTISTFNKAWGVASKNGKLAVENKEIYSKR